MGVSSSVTAQQPAAPPQLPQAPNMTFFVTGAGPGKGADLGGIEGADRHCQTLAARHGAGGKTWRAYLSTQPADGKPAVNARDRIGNGPWQNFKGQVVATSLDDLHSDNNKLGFDNSLSERGLIIPGVGFAPNRHDVLTGSTRGRPRVPGRRRSHLPQLDEQHPGRGDGRPYRQEGPARRRRRRSRGIRRIPRAGPTAAAARAICAAPAATGCSTASPATKRPKRMRSGPGGKPGPVLRLQDGQRLWSRNARRSSHPDRLRSTAAQQCARSAADRGRLSLSPLAAASI